MDKDQLCVLFYHSLGLHSGWEICIVLYTPFSQMALIGSGSRRTSSGFKLNTVRENDLSCSPHQEECLTNGGVSERIVETVSIFATNMSPMPMMMPRMRETRPHTLLLVNDYPQPTKYMRFTEIHR